MLECYLKFFGVAPNAHVLPPMLATALRPIASTLTLGEGVHYTAAQHIDCIGCQLSSIVSNIQRIGIDRCCTRIVEKLLLDLLVFVIFVLSFCWPFETHCSTYLLSSM